METPLLIGEASTRAKRQWREVLALRRNGYSGPFWNGMTTAALGLFILMPWFRFDSTPTYRLMGEFMSEAAWGLFMVATSTLVIVSALKRRPRDVAHASVGVAFTWMVLFLSVVATHPRALIVPVALVLWIRNLTLYREFTIEFDADTGRRRQLPSPHGSGL